MSAGPMTGRVALVTGAASGIGRASAVALARAGAAVVVADVDDAGGQGTVEAILADGGAARWVRCDVSRADEVAGLVRTALEWRGRLDCAHNNAGIEGMPGFTADCTEENWDRVLGVNLKGVWLCLREELRVMASSGGGSIVNTASIAGVVGIKNVPAYVASKHGVVGLTRAAALEYARLGIRVNAVCPGLIRTEMIRRQTGGDVEIERRMEAAEVSGRMGLPDEVAQAVVWLCSDAASFVNGHALQVDGAYTAR
jgi:NAD(P)-dependent dehydrogenase (short-subunit alcohol dehydrogenase family)